MKCLEEKFRKLNIELELEKNGYEISELPYLTKWIYPKQKKRIYVDIKEDTVDFSILEIPKNHINVTVNLPLTSKKIAVAENILSLYIDNDYLGIVTKAHVEFSYFKNNKNVNIVIRKNFVDKASILTVLHLMDILDKYKETIKFDKIVVE